MIFAVKPVAALVFLEERWM